MNALDQARQLLAIKEHRARTRLAILDELFDIQRRIAEQWLAGIRFLALCCSRRAGKTQLLARLIAISLLSSGRNEWTCFAARTLGIAKDLIWSELDVMNERHQLGWKLNASDLSIKTPTGAVFRLVGVDDKASIEKVRGKKFRLFICDEASTYQESLRDLFLSCVQPGLVDIGGSFILSGTPGYVLSGFWFDVATGAADSEGRIKYPSYKRHHWTLRQNPHIKSAEATLADIRHENNWTEEEPIYVREYLGEWRADESALVYAFLRDRNIRPLPVPFDPDAWLVTMGIDYGMKDDTAWSVLGSPPNDPRTWVLHASKANKLLPDEVSERTEKLVKRFKPVRVVGDSGGLGSPFVTEWNRRHAERVGIGVIGANKGNKLGGIQIVNGALRSSHLLLVPGEAEALAGELEYLPWLDEAHTKEHPKYANHLSDATKYAFTEHRGYLHRPEKLPEPPQQWTTLEDRLAKSREAAARPWWEED